MAKTRPTIDEQLAEWDRRIDELNAKEHVSECARVKLKHEFRVHVAGILKNLANELEGWTKRCDDAKRIPDVIYDRERDVR